VTAIRAGTAADRAAELSWSVLVFLFAVAFLAYTQTVTYEFVADDEFQVLRNPWLRHWSDLSRLFATHVWAFSRSDGVPSYYRPLHMMVYALVYGVAGLRPEGFHIATILLHGACTALVAVLGVRLTGDKAASVAAGILFALHPVHAESVAWIAGLMDPLCAAFYLGALCAHVKGCGGLDTRTAGLGTAALFLAALLSKEMAFSLPLVILWFDWCVCGRFRWKRYAAILGVFVIYSGLRVAALSSFLVEHLPLQLSLWDRLLSTVVIAGTYVIKAFFPYDISPFHVFRSTTTPFDPKFIAASGALLLLAMTAWWQRADRKILFLIGCFVLTLLPVLNVTGLGWNVFAERYLYLSSVASCLLMPLLAQRIWKLRPAQLDGFGPTLATAGLVLVSLWFITMLANTTYMWRDAYTLYTETLKRSPDAGMIARQLASLQMARGQYDEAEVWALKAKELNEGLFAKYRVKDGGDDLVLGALSLVRNQPVRALEYFQKAHEIDPRNAKAVQQIGSVYAAIGDYARARHYYEEASRINARSEAAYSNLAFVEVMTGNYDRAIEQARKALDIYPWYGDAYLNLARAYAGKGMTAEARQAYSAARDYSPRLSPAVERELSLLGPP
jgi:protein O-mannosyl-transferase